MTLFSEVFSARGRLFGKAGCVHNYTPREMLTRWRYVSLPQPLFTKRLCLLSFQAKQMLDHFSALIFPTVIGVG